VIFYHFTGTEYIESIKAEGLTTGEVPLSAGERLNAVWLTTDRSPEGHGLGDGWRPTEEMRRMYNLPPKTVFPDKRAVRITLVWPRGKVIPWLPWARKRLESDWFDRMVRTGGGMKKAKTWFLSWQPIPPSAFREIENLRPSRTPRPDS
jgi:hypothetical protein